MRIALRTSGGRGEYEVAGSHAGVKASDVVDLGIILEMLPGCKIQTRNFPRHTQGKPRIRLEKSLESKPKHIYLILADALLLPKPKREISVTPGGKLQLVDNNFSVISVQFSIIKKDYLNLTIHPTDIIVSNSDDLHARIDVVERMRIILNTWGNCQKNASPLHDLIRRHRDAFVSGVEERLHEAALAIRAYLRDPEDPLRQISIKLGLTDSYTYWMGLHTTDVEEFIQDEDLTDFREAARNRIRRWRQQVSRDSAAIRFSNDVKIAYNNTCLFTGYHLPKTSVTGSSGVDSAHILPWAEYDLNSVNNGLCLNKLCHWAFDSGVLRLDFDERYKQYVISIPENFLTAEKAHQIDLTPFKKIVGAIPQSRLPENPKNWPRPDYLKEYNQNMLLFDT